MPMQYTRKVWGSQGLLWNTLCTLCAHKYGDNRFVYPKLSVLTVVTSSADRRYTGMTTLGTQEPAILPDATGHGSLIARVATLPASVRHRLLSNAVSTGAKLAYV